MIKKNRISLKDQALFPIYVCLIILMILFLLLSVSLLTSAQEKEDHKKPGLTASLDRDTVHIGGIVELTLSYHIPEGSRIGSPPDIKGLEDLTIIETKMGHQKITIKLLADRLTSWETDRIDLAFIDKDGNSRVMSSEPLSLTVLSNLGERPEEAQLRNIQDILPAKPLWMKYLFWAGILILLLLIGYVVFMIYRRHKEAVMTSELMDPPHVTAKREITELEAQRLFEKGDVKGFYFRFSGIMKRYLERLRGFPAAEYTTEEISSHIREEEDRILIPVFKQADLAKFADYIPSPARKEQEIETALSYIETTSPSPMPGEDERKDGG